MGSIEYERRGDFQASCVDRQNNFVERSLIPYRCEQQAAANSTIL